MSAAEEYFFDILSGEIVTSQKVKKLAEIMLPRFKRGYKQWHFDEEAATRPVRFIETECPVTTGRSGRHMKLEPFQRAIVETAFGFVDDEGRRQFQNVLVIEGRKNGKTTLCAALELYMLIGDREGTPQIYNVASSKDQASLAYGAAVNMYKRNKRLAKALRNGIVKQRKQDGIICDRNMGYITPLSSQTRNLDGLDVHFAVIDELSAIVNRDVYDLVRQGIGSREQPMLFTITTNGFVRGGIFDAEYDYAARWLEGNVDDDRLLAFIYELDARDEWHQEEAWIKANPGLGTIKKLDYLRNIVRKAEQEPGTVPTVLTKEFNIPENQSAAWLTFEEAVNDTVVDMDAMGFKYCVAGFDASDTIDLSAAKALMMKPGDEHIYVRSMYWIPEDALAAWAEKGQKERDDVPYRQWIARGLLRTVPGNVVPKSVFHDWLVELRDKYKLCTFAIGFDPWHMTDREVRELEMLVGESRCFRVRQGPQTLSDPMKRMKADYAAHRFIDNHHPINEWCRMNVAIKTDINDNIQPDKKGRNPKNRIDGWAAECDAYITLLNVQDMYLGMI